MPSTCVVLYCVQDILVYIAKEGVATADVFRRPGNPNDTRRIVKRLSEGKQVIYSNYSFYTLASVVKVSKKKKNPPTCSLRKVKYFWLAQDARIFVCQWH